MVCAFLLSAAAKLAAENVAKVATVTAAATFLMFIEDPSIRVLGQAC